jgi:hypothetical protein
MDFKISYTDVVVFGYNYRPPIDGDADNPEGTDGYFEFRVSPAIVNNSAYSSGTIKAIAFDATGNDSFAAASLRATKQQNGSLRVAGLTPGRQWSVYSIAGTLIYSSIATDNEANILLPAHGLYIIRSGSASLKVVY